MPIAPIKRHRILVKGSRRASARVLLIALTLACSEPKVRPDHCDFVVEGVCIANDAHDKSLELPEAPERLRAVLEQDLTYWGGTFADLKGWAIVYTHGPLRCGDIHASGCTWHGQRTIQVQLVWANCFEGSFIGHELGHVFIRGRDQHHKDPRWKIGTNEVGPVLMVRAMTRPGATPACSTLR